MPAVDRSDMLILFASIGSGHEMAAAAIEEQARAIAGADFSVRRLDLLALMRLPRKTRLSAAPTLPAVGAVYDALWGAEFLGSGAGGLARLAQPLVLPRFAEHIPAGTGVVVSTHALGAILTAKIPDMARVSVMTDLMPHAFWPREVDCLCAATPEARDALLGRGFAAEQLAVTGIPVRSQFAELPDRGAARARLGLAFDRPVALLAAGAEDPGPYARLTHRVSGVLNALLDAGLAPLVLTGNDAELLGHIRAQFPQGVVALPFTEDMATPMAAADVVIAKPGGSLIAECLACGKPLVLLARGRGQERANSEYLEARGAALIAEDETELREKLATVLGSEESLRAMGEAARALGRRDGARRVAEIAIDACADRPI
jgi:processive 1,2-diacylglycerol beta-glucosyltransferase